MARFELPVMKTSLRAPAASASSAAYWISGLSTMGSISFGLALVAGRNRVPRPATGKTAVLISGAWVTAHLRRIRRSAMIPGRQVAAPSLSGRKRPRTFRQRPSKGAASVGLLALLAWRALALGIHPYVGTVAVEHLGADAFDLAQ